MVRIHALIDIHVGVGHHLVGSTHLLRGLHVLLGGQMVAQVLVCRWVHHVRVMRFFMMGGPLDLSHFWVRHHILMRQPMTLLGRQIIVRVHILGMLGLMPPIAIG